VKANVLLLDRKPAQEKPWISRHWGDAWRGHDLKYVRTMKNLIRGTVLSLCFAIACVAYGAVPPLNVTVSDPSGKLVFRGKTDAQGTFTTDKIKPGVYDVQFISPSAITGNYSIKVSAGVKHVSAAGIAGEKFAKGVALKVNVQNLWNIVGEVKAN
jgi:hypothetical protein